MRLALILLALLVPVMHAEPAHAHRLSVFAFADGTMITGSAYFSGGGAPDGAAVTVFGPDGSVLGQTTTDAEGEFSLPLERRVDHRITVETEDGHAAEFVIAAGELPVDLPGDDDIAAQPATDMAAAAAAVPDAPPAGSLVDEAALEALVSRAVQQQVRPLREQLSAYTDAVRFQEIIGGIGYIVGIFGLAAFMLSRRRRVAGAPTKHHPAE